MGCSASRNQKSLKTLQSQLPQTLIPLVDPLFQEASDLLLQIQNLHNRFSSTIQTMSHLSGTDQLESYNNLETIRVLFWAISAHFKGDIKKAGITISVTEPHIIFNYQDDDEIALIYQSLNEYVKVLYEGDSILPKILTRLAEVKKEIIKDRTLLSSLSPKQKFAIYEANLKHVINGIEITKEFLAEIRRNGLALINSIPKIREMLSESDIVGHEAHQEQVYNPLDIFLKYHTHKRKLVLKEILIFSDNQNMPRKLNDEIEERGEVDDGQRQINSSSPMRLLRRRNPLSSEENIENGVNNQQGKSNLMELTFAAESPNINRINQMTEELCKINKENNPNQEQSDKNKTPSKRYPKRLYQPFKKQNSSVIYNSGIIQVKINDKEYIYPGGLEVIASQECVDDLQEEGIPHQMKLSLMNKDSSFHCSEAEVFQNNAGLENLEEERSPKKPLIKESSNHLSLIARKI